MSKDDRDTTISELFWMYLDDMARTESIRREYVADELDRLFEKSIARSEGSAWTRDSLHERYNRLSGHGNPGVRE